MKFWVIKALLTSGNQSLNKLPANVLRWSKGRHFSQTLIVIIPNSYSIWRALTEGQSVKPLRTGGLRSIDKTTQAVTNQIRAMGCEVFEIGLFNPSATGKDPAMLPRTWDADTLLRSVPWLKHQNQAGRNIYVRPRGEHNLTLVDDLNDSGIRTMKASGFAPALVVQTSPGNFQAWLKHPEVLSKELSTAAAKTVAARFGGDLGAADWRHFGRLAGFTNRKEKYRTESGLYPFVLLVEHSGLSYSANVKLIAEARSAFEITHVERQRIVRASEARMPNHKLLKGIDAFRSDPRYSGDGTRIDLAYAIYAFSHGANSDDVAAALRSRDLSHKGIERRQDDYVQRTVQKALGAIRTESRSR